VKIYHVSQIKFNRLENVHIITDLPTKLILSDSRVTNISKSFTHKMAAKTSWHRYGTKLRHCHFIYTQTSINEPIHIQSCV